MKPFIIIFSSFCLLLCSFCTLRAQMPNGLTISSPLEGETITGSTADVRITLQNLACHSVGVVLDGIGSAILTQPPYQTTFVLPQNLATATQIKAFCLTSAGTTVNSPPVDVKIDAGIEYISLNASPSPLVFQYPGDQMPLLIQAKTVSRQLVNVTKGPRLSYSSDAPAVAAVSNGLVTATGAGATKIRVKSGQLETDISVSVPKLVAGDLNGDGRVDTEDLNELQTWLNTPANGSNDARDLNHDGIINALDARILTTLCTYPRCATHP